MSKRRTADILEIIRKKTSMSQNIAQRDNDYSVYSGADLQTADKIAKIQTVLKLKIFPKEINILLKIMLVYLDQRRKAYFASTCSELTKLGFILGYKYESIKATK